MADNKFAAYICSGCGIGDVLNVGALEKIAQKEGKMAMVKSHPFLCNAEGVQMIRDDVANEGVTHLCIAACSRRAKAEAFSFPTAAVARANLREGVIWVVAEGSDHDEIRQEMAEDYVRMGCAEVKKMIVPGGNVKESSSKRILVVGGGISGMTAALAAADAGYEVVIVEKSAALGGFARNLLKRVPFSGPYAEPQATGVEEMAARIGTHPRIKAHLNSTVPEADAPGAAATACISTVIITGYSYAAPEAMSTAPPTTPPKIRLPNAIAFVIDFTDVDPGSCPASVQRTIRSS